MKGCFSEADIGYRMFLKSRHMKEHFTEENTVDKKGLLIYTSENKSL